MTKHTVEYCFESMHPLLDDITRLVKSAPLSEGERKGLAMMILAHVAGATLAALGRAPTPDAMRELGEFMASTFTRGIN
jgi:hypothetical protein